MFDGDDASNGVSVEVHLEGTYLAGNAGVDLENGAEGIDGLVGTGPVELVVGTQVEAALVAASEHYGVVVADERYLAVLTDKLRLIGVIVENGEIVENRAFDIVATCPLYEIRYAGLYPVAS